MGVTNRRRFIAGSFGILGAGGVTAWLNRNRLLSWMLRKTSNEDLRISAAPSLDADVCILTPEQVEGPFFIASPIRKDIREDRKGRELNLRIQVVRMPDCVPASGALVEVWHCDAEGIYSGYPEDLPHNPWKTLRLTGTGGRNVKPMNESRFLRGAQQTDGNGIVEFRTVFPGWYEPRAPHVHFKVLIDNRQLLTSQFYFDPELCNRIYLHETPYDRYGSSPYTPANDIAISQHPDARGLVLEPVWNDDLPLEASARVGVLEAT